MRSPGMAMSDIHDPEPEPDFILTDFDPVPGLAEAIRSGETTIVDWSEDEEADRVNEWAREQRRRKQGEENSSMGDAGRDAAPVRRRGPR